MNEKYLDKIYSDLVNSDKSFTASFDDFKTAMGNQQFRGKVYDGIRAKDPNAKATNEQWDALLGFQTQFDKVATEATNKAVSALRNEKYASLSDDEINEKWNSMLSKGEQNKKANIEKLKKEDKQFAKQKPFLHAISMAGMQSGPAGDRMPTPTEALEEKHASTFLDPSDLEEFKALDKERGVRIYGSGNKDMKTSTIAASNEVKDIRDRANRDNKKLSARERIDLNMAERINDMSQELIEAPSKFGEESGVANWGKGLSDTLFDRDIISVVGMVRDWEVSNVVKKLNDGETLTDAENALIMAVANFDEVQASRSSDLSVGYQIGQGTAQCVPLIVDMMVTKGLGAAGKRALIKSLDKLVKAGKMTQKSVDRFARILNGAKGVTYTVGKGDDATKVTVGALEEGAKKTFGQYAGDAARELVETGIQTYAMPSSQRQMIQAKTNLRRDSDSNDISFKDRARIFGNAYVQTFTERAGGKAIDWALGKVFGMTNVLQKFGYDRGILKLLNDAVQNPISEIGEEYLGAIINLVRSADLFDIYSEQSNEDLRDEAMSMFTSEGFWQTVGTTLPMSLFGGASNYGAIKAETNKYNKSYLELSQYLQKSGIEKSQAENILRQVESAKNNAEFKERMSILKTYLTNYIMENNPDTEVAKGKLEGMKTLLDTYSNNRDSYEEAIGGLEYALSSMSKEAKEKVAEDFKKLVDNANRSITATPQKEGKDITPADKQTDGWAKRKYSVTIDGKEENVTIQGELFFNEDGSINSSRTDLSRVHIQNASGKNIRTTVKADKKKEVFNKYLDAINDELRKKKAEKDADVIATQKAEEVKKAELAKIKAEEKAKVDAENAKLEEEKQAIVQQEADRQNIIASFPKDKNGEIDIDKMSPEQFFVYESDTDTPEAAMNTVGDVLNDLYQQLEDNANETNKEKRARNAAKIRNRIRQYEAVVVKYSGQETLDTINAARAQAQALQNTPPVQPEAPTTPPVVEPVAVPIQEAPAAPVQGETPAEPTVAPKEDTPQDDVPAEPDTTPLPPAEPETKVATIEPIDLGGDDIVFVSNSSNVTRVAQRKEDGNLYFVDNGKPVSNAWKETASKVKVYYNGRPYYLLSKTARIGKNGSVVGLNITVHLAPEMYTGKDSELNEIPRDKISLDEQGNQTATGNKLAERVANYKSLSDFFNKVIYNAGGVKLTLGELLEIPVVNANKGKGAPSWQFQVKRFIEQQEGKRNQTDVRADIEAGLKELIADWNAYVKANGLTDVVTEDNATDYYSRLKELGGYTSNGLLVQSTDFNGGKLNSADATKNPILQLLVMLDQASELASEKGPSLRALEVSNIRGYVQKKPSSMTTEEIEAEMFLTDNQGERVRNYGISTQRYNALNAELERRQAPEREAQGQLEKELDEKERNQEEQLIDSYANEIVNLLAASSNGNAIQKAAARGRVIDMLKGNSTLRKGVYDKLASMQNEDSAEVIESAMNLIAKHYPEVSKTSTKKAEQEKPKPATSTPSLKELNDEYNDIKSKLDEYYYETEDEIDAANKRLAELRALLENTEFMIGDVLTEHAESTKRIIKILKAAGIRVVTFKNKDLPKYVSKKKLEELSDGQIVYGFASNDTIYLNEDHFNPNSPLHEFTHLWVTAYKQAFAEDWKRFVEIANKSALAANLRKPLKDGNASPYAKLSADEMASEVLSRYTGYLYGELDAEGRTAFENMMQAQTTEEKIAEKSLLNRIRNIWKKIISWFDKSIENEKNEETIDDMIRRFAQAPMETLARGREAVDELKQIAVVSKLDAEYMDAVNRGDMETAQRLVNEAAKMSMPNTKVVDENGNPLIVFHGSPYSNITTFEHTKGSQESGLKEFGTYFTSNPLLAELYKNGRSISDEMRNKIDGEIAKLREQQNSTRNNREYDALENEINLLKQAKEGKVYTCFLNIESPKEFDAKHQDGWAGWHELKQDVGYDVKRGTDAIEAITGNNKSAVMDEQYDGIIAHDIMDIHSNELKEELFGDAYLVWNPTQIKSAEPVTYDDNGNVIPLSERFNLGKDDIRYMIMLNNTSENLDNPKKSITFAQNNENYERNDERTMDGEVPSGSRRGESRTDSSNGEGRSLLVRNVPRANGGYDADVAQSVAEQSQLLSEMLTERGIKHTSQQVKLATPQEFYDAIIEAKQLNTHGWMVDAYDVEDYAGFTCLLTEDGKSGIAIKPNGDIISVFSSVKRDNRLQMLMPMAIIQGGRKLDCYYLQGENGNIYGLPKLYSTFGFKIAATTNFVEEYVPQEEYARWKEEHNGSIQGVAAMYISDEVANDLINNYNLSAIPNTNAQNFPSADTGYGEALAERDKLMILENARANGTIGTINGKKSNLPDELWTIVRTDAFKNWFGDWINDKDNASVVLDENGEPLVVYHGSRMAGFDQFGRGEARDSQGIYTTPNRRAAESYATSVEEWKSGQTMPEAELGAPDHHGVYSLFVNMRNPKVIDFGGKRFDEYGEPKYEVATNEALDNGERGILFDTLEEAEAYIAEHPEEDLDYVEKRTTSDDMLVQAKEEGYDGVIFTNIIDSRYPDPITNYVPFESNQVKSATQNIGTFNAEDNRIEFMIGPAAANETEEKIKKASEGVESAFVTADVPLPDKTNRLAKWATAVCDSGEAFRQFMKALRKYRKKNHLGKLPECRDIRQIYDNQRVVLKNKVDELLNLYETPLEETLEKLIKVVENSAMYQKYKEDRVVYTFEEEDADGKITTKTWTDYVEITPREFIERYLIACDSVERLNNGIPPRGLREFYSRMGVNVYDFQMEFEAAFASDGEGEALVKELWKRINAYTNYTLEDSYECGMLTEEEYNKRKARKFYVPERDFQAEKELEQTEIKPQKHYRSNKLASSKQAKGGDSLAANIIENMIHIGNIDLSKNNKNRVKLAMFNLLKKNEDFRRSIGLPKPEEVWYDSDGKRVSNKPSKTLIERIKWLEAQIAEYDSLIAIEEAQAVPDMAEIAQLEKEMQDLIDERRGIPYMLEYDARDKFFGENNPHMVGVYVDGVLCSMQFPNMGLIATALNDTWADSLAVRDVLKRISGFMGSVITSYEPSFFTVNTVTDSMAILTKGYVELGLEYSARFIATTKDLGKHMSLITAYMTGKDYRSMENGDLFRDFLMNGGNTGYATIRNMETILEELQVLDNKSNHIKDTKKWLKKTLSFTNESAELLLRFAAYKAAIDCGYGIEKATWAANNLSANFNRTGKKFNDTKFGWRALGEAMEWFKSLSMFTNPAIQGAMSYLRMFGDSGELSTKERVAKYFRLFNAAMFMPVLCGFLNAMMFDDDEQEEWAVSEYDRANYFVLGKLGKWAVPHMLRPFYNIGVNIAMCMQGRRTGGDIADSIITSFLTHLTPLPPVLTETASNGVHSAFGNADFTFFDGIESLVTPQGINTLKELADGENFLGYKVRYEGSTAQYTKNPNAGAFEKIIAEQFYILGGGIKGSDSKITDDKDTIGRFWDVSPNEVKSVMQLFLPKLVIDVANITAGSVSEEHDVRLKDIPVVNRFTSDRTKEAYRAGIYSEANKVVKANEEIAKEAKGDITRLKIDFGKASSEEERVRIQNEIDFYEGIYKQAKGDVFATTIEKNLEKYKRIRMASLHKKYHHDEKSFKKLYPDLRYDVIEDAEKMFSFNMFQLVCMYNGTGKVNDNLPNWMKDVFRMNPSTQEVNEMWEHYHKLQEENNERLGISEQ